MWDFRSGKDIVGSCIFVRLESTISKRKANAGFFKKSREAREVYRPDR